MCSNINHCCKYIAAQHCKWRDEFRIKCICSEWNFLKMRERLRKLSLQLRTGVGSCV